MLDDRLNPTMHCLRVTLLALCAFGLVPTVASATESVYSAESGWWKSPDSTTLDDVRFDVDPASAMRLRIVSVADGHREREKRTSVSPCDLERTKHRRFICWSSHGRKLHMTLPTLVWDMVYTLRPRTLYTYKSVDVRMPPSVRLRLPFNATTNVGYEDEFFGVRVGVKF